MNTKVPPDIVLLACAIVMWLVTKYLSGFRLLIPCQAILSGVIMLFGLIISFLAKAALHKHRTTERSDQHSLPKATTLVTTGVYRFSRNPMYLGMAVLLIGWTLMLMNWLNIIGAIAFVGFITKFQILPEEKVLEYTFDDVYRHYKNKVRRWI